MERKQPTPPADPAPPDPAETVQKKPGEYTTLDEGVMESFPASDPVSVEVDRPFPAEEEEAEREREREED
jgi:hypothetical protein